MDILIILGVLVAIALFVIMLYNRLVALRQNRNNAFSDIDVQLRQRLDTLPNLVEIVKNYASHEREVFQRVTEARARIQQSGSGPTHERLAAEGAMGGALMNLFAVAENYPQLKADQNFQQLQAELTDLENKIAAARRYFNSATAEYNTAIQQFPAVLIAKQFGFTDAEFFELAPDVATRAAEPPALKF